MDVTLSKKVLVNRRVCFLLSGVLLGIYVNVLHTVPFMKASDFFAMFGIIGLSMVALPAVVATWSLKGHNYNAHQKVCLFFHGMTISSVAFVAIYLIETLAGNYAGNALTIPLQFPISKAPPTSFLVSLILTGLFALSIQTTKLRVGKSTKIGKMQTINT